MQKRVMINMMGDFSISVDGVPHAHLVAKSRKGISLLQYLILERGKHVPSQRLVRELWSGSHCDGPENALKTMVSRGAGGGRGGGRPGADGPAGAPGEGA